MACTKGGIIDQRIFFYVKDAVSKGYAPEQIRQHLISSNFPKNDVDEAVDYFLNMQESSLKATVSNWQHLGYSPEIIRQQLLRLGNSPAAVERIMGNQTINVRHEVHIASKTFLILFLLLIIGGAGYYVLNYTDILKGNDVLLDISISTDNEYTIGQDIKYQVTLTSMGSGERFDAKITYTIIDSNNAVKKSYSETIAVDTKASSSGKIVVPSTVGAGTYKLKAVVEYEGKTAESEADFVIIEANNIPPKQTSNPNPPIPSNIPTNNNGNTPSNPSSIPPTTPKVVDPNFSDALAIIRQQSSGNDALAAKNCEKFSAEQKDICYSTVAEESNKIAYCENIKNVNIKDNCYIYFVIKGNSVVCSKIADEYSRNYCKQADIVNQMQQAYMKNDTEQILKLSKSFEPNIYSNTPAPPNFNYIYSQSTAVELEDIATAG